MFVAPLIVLPHTYSEETNKARLDVFFHIQIHPLMGSSTDANLPVLFDLKFIRTQTDLYKTVVDRIRVLYPDLEDDSVSAVAKEYFREKLSCDPMEMARSINEFTRGKLFWIVE